MLIKEIHRIQCVFVLGQDWIRRRRFHRERVDWGPVLPHPEIQVRSRRHTCGTDIPDHFSLLYTRSGFDSLCEPGEVEIGGLPDRVMPDLDLVSPASGPAGTDHGSISNALHWSTCRSRIIDPRMGPDPACHRMFPMIGESRRDPGKSPEWRDFRGSRGKNLPAEAF